MTSILCLLSCSKKKVCLRKFKHPISWIWTIGHAEIWGNEVADALANIGSQKSRLLNLPPAQIPTDGHFDYNETSQPIP